MKARANNLPLLLGLLLACARGTRCLSESRITVMNTLQRTIWGTLEDEGGGKPAEPQRLQVIGAGFGRTGTSSLVVALRRLGFNSYHMKEGVVDKTGHLEMWDALARTQLNLPYIPEAAHQQNAEETEEEKSVIDAIARDGFNATVDFPACLLYSKMLRRYPDAQIILSVRSSGDVWATSVLDTIGQATEILSRAPWHMVPTARSFFNLNLWIWKMIGAAPDVISGKLNRDQLAEAHDAWIQRVVNRVPKKKLLLFQASQGWKPLCKFLSPLDHAIERICSDVISNGEAFPHTNERAELRRVFLVIRILTGAWPWLLAISLGMCIYVLARCCKCRVSHGRKLGKRE